MEGILLDVPLRVSESWMAQHWPPWDSLANENLVGQLFFVSHTWEYNVQSISSNLAVSRVSKIEHTIVSQHFPVCWYLCDIFTRLAASQLVSSFQNDQP